MAETSPVRILIADDQQDVIDALRLLLLDEGFEVTPARSPGEALDRLEATDFDLAVLDLNYTRDTTSGQEGFDLMERIRALDPTLPVLVMTAWSSVSGAVEAMRRGARDYIEKPWDDERLLVGGADPNRAAAGATAQSAAAGSQQPPPARRRAGVHRRHPGDPRDSRRRSIASRRRKPAC